MNSLLTDYHMQEDVIELWKFRELIKNLNLFESDDKTLISLFISPLSSFDFINKFLNVKKGKAAKLNLFKKIEAIEVIQRKLDLYSRIPKNGLIIFYGRIRTPSNDEVTVNIDFEPFKLVYRTRIAVQDYFDTSTLQDLIEHENSMSYLSSRLNREKRILDDFYRFSAMNTNESVIRGANECVKAICEYNVNLIVVREDFDIYKITFKSINNHTKLKTLYSPLKQISTTIDHLKKDDYELCDQVLLVEWLVDNYKHYGCQLEIISKENHDLEYFTERFDKIACTLRIASTMNPWDGYGDTKTNYNGDDDFVLFDT